jgi:hypothetical protein
MIEGLLVLCIILLILGNLDGDMFDGCFGCLRTIISLITLILLISVLITII